MLSAFLRKGSFPPPKPGSLKSVTLQEECPLECSLDFFFLSEPFPGPYSTVPTAGFPEASWRPQQHPENEHTSLHCRLEEEKTGLADLAELKWH